MSIDKTETAPVHAVVTPCQVEDTMKLEIHKDGSFQIRDENGGVHGRYRDAAMMGVHFASLLTTHREARALLAKAAVEALGCADFSEELREAICRHLNPCRTKVPV